MNEERLGDQARASPLTPPARGTLQVRTVRFRTTTGRQQRLPSHAAHRHLLGSCYSDQGRWRDALPYFRSLFEDDRDDMQ